MTETVQESTAAQELGVYLLDTTSTPVPAEILQLAETLKARYRDRVQAVLVYGSTLREPDFTDAVVDVYVLVDAYQGLYGNRFLEYCNTLIAPNVFYMENDFAGARIRCKYAVVTHEQFVRGCRQWFHSYLWGRFCQPVRLVYADTDKTREEIIRALTSSVLRLLNNACLFAPGERVSAQRIWARGLSLSYAAELRPEDAARAKSIVASDAAYYEQLFTRYLPAANRYYGEQQGELRIVADISAVNRLKRQWRLRRLQGKFLSVLRLAKAALTFYDCVDYAAWKIHRHTGEKIEVTPALRKQPLLFGWLAFYRLLKKGALK